MGYNVAGARNTADDSRVAARAWLVDSQRNLVNDLARLIHLNEPLVAALGYHCAAIGEALESVHAEPAGVARFRFRFVFPNRLFFACNFLHRRTDVIQDIAVWKQLNVVHRVGFDRKLPLHLTSVVDDSEVLIVEAQNAIFARVDGLIGRNQSGCR